MFRVLIEEYTNVGSTRTMDVVLKTEKFFELIGRYTFKYSTPDEVIEEEGCRIYEFFKVLDEQQKTFMAVRISFAKVGEEETKAKPSNVKHYAPPTPLPPPPPKLPEDDRLISMVTQNIIKKSYYQ